MMTPMPTRPIVRESYEQHVPPAWVRPTVERLLSSLAPEHIGRLSAVVLTDSRAIGKGRTGRVGARKYRRNECRGFYHARSRAGEAWVEIVVDNVRLSDTPAPLLWFQFVRDIVIAETLYHEVGHHLDETVGAARRRGEAAAEDWRKRLSRIHFQKKYWYLRPVVHALRPVVKLLRRTRRKRNAG